MSLALLMGFHMLEMILLVKKEQGVQLDKRQLFIKGHELVDLITTLLVHVLYCTIIYVKGKYYIQSTATYYSYCSRRN